MGCGACISLGAHFGARLVLVVASVIALISFGAQLFVAPVLLPLQWLAARDSDRPGRVVFTGLAVLLLFEVGWIGGYILTQSEPAAVVIAIAWTAIAGVAFKRTAWNDL